MARIRSLRVLGRDRVQRFGMAAVAAVALVGCVSASGFVMAPYTSADGQFTVSVPAGKMTEQTRPGSGHFAGSTIHFLTGGLADGPRLAVVYADATDTGGRTAEQVLDDSIQGNLQTTGGTLIEQHAITVHGLGGREERVAANQQQYVFRLFAVGKRLYSLSVTGSTQQVGVAHAFVFLDSFEVLP